MPPVLPISGSELRRATVTVDDFLTAGAVPLQLALVAGTAGRRNPIPEGALNRPGLALSGFLTFFANRRIQILGFHEWSYLGSVTPEERAAKLRAVFAQQLPAVIVCRGLNLDEVPELKPLADETKTPLLTTPMLTHEFVNAATLIIEELASPYRIVHGTMIEVHGQGVLLMGEAGIGKSETALALVKRGHALVADDTTRLWRERTGRIMAASIPPIQNLMDIRGVGIVNIREIYGITAVRGQKQLDLIIRLVGADEAEKLLDRTGVTPLYRDVCGVQVPEIVLPVAPGRDTSTLVETAVCEHKLRVAGVNAVQDLERSIVARNLSAKNTLS
jgi:HPr kinase/phosphorylase